MRLAGVVVGGVRDAEPAAEVDLGQLDAVLVTNVGEKLNDAPSGDFEPRHVEDLGPDVGVNPDELKPVELEGAAHSLGGLPPARPIPNF